MLIHRSNEFLKSRTKREVEIIEYKKHNVQKKEYVERRGWNENARIVWLILRTRWGAKRELDLWGYTGKRKPVRSISRQQSHCVTLVNCQREQCSIANEEHELLPDANQIISAALRSPSIDLAKRCMRLKTSLYLRSQRRIEMTESE